MNHVEILSLPLILFSHFYQANAYQNHFSVRKNFLEISYIAEGSLNIKIGSEAHRAQKGDVICFLHDAKVSVSTDTFHCHHTVGVAVDWCFSDDEQNALLLPVITSVENNTVGICRIIDDLIHNQILYKASSAKSAAKILELLCGIDECNRKNQISNSPGDQLYIKRAKAYIQENIHTCITQNSIAEHLGISPEYLCSVFKKAEGTTMMRYINTTKLERIKALIDHTDLHLYEAAAIYGYNDPNYVSRLYKRLFGYNITDKPLIHPELK